MQGSSHPRRVTAGDCCETNQFSSSLKLDWVRQKRGPACCREGIPEGWRLLQSLERHSSLGHLSEVCLLTSMSHSAATASGASTIPGEGACSLDRLEKGSLWLELQGMPKTKVPGQVTAKGHTNLSLSRSKVELNLA